MCGYIGKVSFSSFDDKDLESSNNLITCRGPDSKRKIKQFEEDLKYSLIFNRLSILDLNEKANQPMFSKNKEQILMFNGEIYNHRELRRELENKIEFITDHSDSEVLLNGIYIHGIDYVRKLRGQFSFFYLDKKKKKIYLARDRLGQKPLYYKQNDKSLIFSSNLKSLVSFERDYKLDQKSVSEYLNYGAISSPNTIFSNFKKVNPSEIIEFEYKNNYIDKKFIKYWEVESYIDNKTFDTEEFFNIFSDSINIRNEADVPIANFLSGGIDSSSIIKNLYNKKNEINTFSIKVDDSQYDEGPWSDLVANKYRTNHKSVVISSKINFENINESINCLDEPYSDPSVVPSYILSKEISKYYKVAISGDGGDELLGGYARTALSLKSTTKIHNLISNLYPFYPPFMGTGNYFLSKSSNLTSKYSSFLEDKNLLKLLNTENVDTRKNIKINRNIEEYKSLLIADYNFYLPDMMLFKIDRTSMANSLEIRSPFVDHKLIEYIFSHDTNYYSISNPKSLLKEYLLEDFDKNFVNRKKQGFVFDIENWIFSNINEISEIIYSGKVSEIITSNAIKSLSRFKSRINSHRIWKLYVLNNYLSTLN